MKFSALFFAILTFLSSGTVLAEGKAGEHPRGDVAGKGDQKVTDRKGKGEGPSGQVPGDGPRGHEHHTPHEP